MGRVDLAPADDSWSTSCWADWPTGSGPGYDTHLRLPLVSLRGQYYWGFAKKCARRFRAQHASFLSWHIGHSSP